MSSLEVGGMEHVVVRLATAQKRAGHRVRVLAIRGGPLENDLAKNGVAYEVLDTGRVRRGLRALRYFHSINPNVVHAHNPTSLHYSVLAKLVSRAGIVVTIHGEANARLGSTLEWNLVSAVGVVSHAALRNLRLPCDAKKLRVVHNGIAPVTYNRVLRDAARYELGVSQSFVAIIVARLSGFKGHATLLRSLEQLRSRGVDLVLLIAGDGAERSELERKARELCLDSRMVRFLGARSDVDRLLLAADLFVLPSDTEGLPLSVLEAMAYGLPIVASDVGGIPELIDHDHNGLLVSPGDPNALADAIGRLVDDPGLRRRLADAALSRVGSEFSLSTTVHKYDQLYRQTIR